MSEAKIVPLKSGVEISSFNHLDRGPLVAAFAVTIPAWNLKMRCLWFRMGEKEWIALPNEKFAGNNGKTKYKPLVEFTDKVAEERFQAAVLAAVKPLVR